MSELNASEISNQKLKEEHLSQKNGLQVSHKISAFDLFGIIQKHGVLPDLTSYNEYSKSTERNCSTETNEDCMKN